MKFNTKGRNRKKKKNYARKDAEIYYIKSVKNNLSLCLWNIIKPIIIKISVNAIYCKDWIIFVMTRMIKDNWMQFTMKVLLNQLILDWQIADNWILLSNLSFYMISQNSDFNNLSILYVDIDKNWENNSFLINDIVTSFYYQYSTM